MTTSIDSRPPLLTLAACAAAAATVFGSLYLSAGMGLVACPLCFYQRTFALAVFAVLVMGLLTGADRATSLAALALPLAIGGLAVALFHVRLELIGKLECPAGVLELGTAPKQSAAAFLVVTALLLLDVGVHATVPRPLALLGGVGLGVALAAACVFTAPPPPQLTAEDYKKPLVGCRPPQKKAD